MDAFSPIKIFVMKTAAYVHTHGRRINGRFFCVFMSFAVLWGASAPVPTAADEPFRGADIIDETGRLAREWTANRAATAPTIHSSSAAVWQVYDTNAYLKYKSNIDSLMALFDRAVPTVLKYLGVSVPLPVQVIIDSGDCCAAWASMNAVGFRIENFNSNAVFPNCDGFNAPGWTRGVIIGEFTNHAQAVGSSGCPPRNWWVDGVWYFPDMVVVNVLAELLDSAAARYWEQHMDCRDLMTVPLYRAFKDLRLRRGWSAYQNAFKAIRDDTISFCNQFTNPSALLTNYTLAYLSLGAKENVAEAFRVAGADSADSAVVNRILSARNSLRNCPNQAGGSAAWQAYRSGNYQAVTVCSPYVFRRRGNLDFFPGGRAPATGAIRLIDISGRIVKEYSFGRELRDRSVSDLWMGRGGQGILDKTGVYIIRISSGNRSFVKKLAVVR